LIEIERFDEAREVKTKKLLTAELISAKSIGNFSKSNLQSKDI